MKEKHDRAYYENQLTRSILNMARLNEEGVEALSVYDITIAHQGDADQALKTAKYLVGNHINYFKKHLDELSEVPEQGTLFDVSKM